MIILSNQVCMHVQDMIYALDHAQLRFSMDENKGKYLLESTRQRGSMLESILSSHMGTHFCSRQFEIHG